MSTVNKGLQISRTGLSLYYNVNDPKSFRGPDSANLANGVYLGFSGDRWLKVTNYPRAGRLPFKLESDVYKLVSGNNYWGNASDFSVAYGKTYIVSFWYYQTAPNIVSLWSSRFFGTPRGGSGIYNNVSTEMYSTFDLTIVGKWTFGYSIICTNVPVDSYSYFRGTYTLPSYNDDNPAGDVYIANFKFEEADFPTAFNTTARTNSLAGGGGLVDLSGNNKSIDLTSMWFDDEGPLFDGISGYTMSISSAQNSSGAIIDNRYDFSLQFWLRPNSSNFPLNACGHKPSVLFELPGTGTAYYLGLWAYLTSASASSSTMSLVAQIASTADNNVSSASTGTSVSTTINRNEWTHITITYTGFVIRIYLNGVLAVTSSALTNNSYFWDGAINMGYIQNNCGPSLLHGKIQEVKVYKKALSASEIYNDYLVSKNIYILKASRYSNYGSSLTNPAYSALDITRKRGDVASGLYYIITSNGVKQVYCDMTTRDEYGQTGWMLVGSWDTDYQWSLKANSSDSVFGTTAMNCVSSNFGNMKINHFRILASAAATTVTSSASADWYYQWNTKVRWKEVWAPDASRTQYYSSYGNNVSLPRGSLKAFDLSYNLKFSVKNSFHKYNGLSDYGFTPTADVSNTGITNAPVVGLCRFHEALLYAGRPFGAFNLTRTGDFEAGTGADADGTLAIGISTTSDNYTGQDRDVNVAAKVGYDDNIVWSAYTTSVTSAVTTANNISTKLWWWIK
jgi:hypothetical protein